MRLDYEPSQMRFLVWRAYPSVEGDPGWRVAPAVHGCPIKFGERFDTWREAFDYAMTLDGEA